MILNIQIMQIYCLMLLLKRLPNAIGLYNHLYYDF